ncbi:MAG: TIGR02281 family clan AA aspartic protease [Sphingomonas sp.]|nr:TIGR02281 family clan AA aspartic protease [Sphingomonas sp.]
MIIAIGVVIGAVMPAPRKSVPAGAAPSLAGATPSPAGATPIPDGTPRDSEMPRETVLARSGAGHFLAVADVNRMPVRFVVDTGADTVALTVEDAERAGVRFDRAQFQTVGQGAGGPVMGQVVTIDEITLDGKRATAVPGVVLEGASVSLLGHSYLRQLASVSIEGDTMRLR